MKVGMLTRRPLLWGLVALLAAVGGGLAAWSSRSAPRGQGTLEQLDVYGRVPDFSLVERSGRSVTRADLLGKVWVANAIYTQCPETCPLQSLEISRLQAEFATEPDLRLISITVDPARDTPEVLSGYAARYGAHPDRWLFLTGDEQTIYPLIREGFRLGVVAPEAPHQTGKLLRWLAPVPALATHGAWGMVLHSSRFVLVDRQARIRAYHRPDDELSLAHLRQNLRRLLGGPPHGQ
jgi:protein SCO1/2